VQALAHLSAVAMALMQVSEPESAAVEAWARMSVHLLAAEMVSMLARPLRLGDHVG
jgi:hypothetical protein